MKKSLFRRILSLCLTLLLLGGPAALAEEPEVGDRKGVAPAEGPWLDPQFDADGSAYDNPPTQVKRVRIGLNFGNSALYEAVFRSEDGGGFRIGVYEADRSFTERCRTESSTLRVVQSGDKNAGLVVLEWGHRIPLYASGEEESLAIEPLEGETLFEYERYRGGFECRRATESRVTVINCVDLEDYVKGVIPYEMSGSWPLEALKAQAVCARTYVVYNQEQYADEGFDLTDDTNSQVYRGSFWANERTDYAVDATAGQLLRYRGELCEIYYFASDGGATLDGSVAFGSDRPYLRGKLDPFERAVDYSYRSWEQRWVREQLIALLRNKGYDPGDIEDVEPIYSDVGAVIAIRYIPKEGKPLVVEGLDCFRILRLPSAYFTVTKGDEEWIYDFKGSGLGHNCGLSQWGARAMDEVYGYDYRQILAFYFTGAYAA